MPRYLVFQLYGVMASWGDIAVGEERPSWSRPSKSAVLGLLAAAMGLRRHEETMHQAMAEGYGLALRVDDPGILLRDYHTAQVPPQTALKRMPSRTRRDELLALARYNRMASSSGGTILSFREYRCDGAWVVALWARDGAPFGLEELASGLREPRFTLSLGRKSCPPALPLQPQVVEAPTLLRAFAMAELTDAAGLLGSKRLKKGKPAPSYFWDQDGEIGDLRAEQQVVRWDLPRSRARWQFASRPEISGRPGEDPSCT